MYNENNTSQNNSRVFTGLLIIVIGLLFFIRQAGWAQFPHWLFSWPMILIIVGIYVGVKHGFRGAGWLVMLIIGGFFLVDDIMDMYPLRSYLVPAILIGVGIMLIVRPRRNRAVQAPVDESVKVAPMGEPASEFKSQANAANSNTDNQTEEKLEATAIFGAVKRNIVSKNFTGGEAASIFGGSEIDLSQADIQGTVKVEVTAILGGVKLIVPSHWTIKQQVTAIFGGVEDKRSLYHLTAAPGKVLVLEGMAFMGGIEISSYK